VVEFFKWAGWGVMGAAIVAASIFLLPKLVDVLIGYLAFRVKRQEEEDDKHRLEQFRSDLAKGLEQVRAEFASTLEEKKSELARLAARVQHELQREVIRAELLIRSKHRIYPSLGKKLHMAVGGIGQGSAVVQHVPDYEHMSQEELLRQADQYKLSEANRNSLLRKIASDQQEAAKLLHKYRRAQLLEEGNHRRIDAFNYLLFKRLYLSDAVLSKCEALNTLLVSIYVDATMWIWQGTDHETLKKIMAGNDRAIVLLREIDMEMRSELQPKD
jgi:hypothetical protein